MQRWPVEPKALFENSTKARSKSASSNNPCFCRPSRWFDAARAANRVHAVPTNLTQEGNRPNARVRLKRLHRRAGAKNVVQNPAAARRIF